jgi:hypothetical protein
VHQIGMKKDPAVGENENQQNKKKTKLDKLTSLKKTRGLFHAKARPRVMRGFRNFFVGAGKDTLLPSL